MHAYSVTQSCLTLCDFMDYGPPDSSVHGIFQARILEWVAICYSRGSSWPRGQTRISCVSCTDKWILYHSATWETHVSTGHIFFKYSLWEMETITIFNWWFILNFPPPNQQTWFSGYPFSFLSFCCKKIYHFSYLRSNLNSWIAQPFCSWPYRVSALSQIINLISSARFFPPAFLYTQGSPTLKKTFFKKKINEIISGNSHPVTALKVTLTFSMAVP